MLSVNKYSIIQDAMATTGQAVTSQPDDDPDTWEVGLRAFDRAMRTLVAKHNWNFATRTAALTAPLTESPSTRFTRAYALPPDALHIVTISNSPNVTGLRYGPRSFTITEYEILGGKICTNRTDPLYVEYLTLPLEEDSHPLFVEVLTLLVEAGFLRGLNEDFTEAGNREKTAEFRLGEAKARTDAEQPPKYLFVSDLLLARRRRRR